MQNMSYSAPGYLNKPVQETSFELKHKHSLISTGLACLTKRDLSLSQFPLIPKIKHQVLKPEIQFTMTEISSQWRSWTQRTVQSSYILSKDWLVSQCAP